MGAFAGPDISESGLVLALDAANKKSYSQNEFQYSTDIFGWFSGNSGGANAAIVSRDTINSPIGNTPLKMEVTGNDPHLGSYNEAKWNIAPAINGQTWIVSVYVKANVATTGEILIFGANSAGTGYVGGAWLSLTSVTVNIGTEWTRFHHVHTMNNADIAFIHTRLDGPESGGTGQTLWWDGLQVERVPSGTTTPTPFTSSYYGGSVYRNLIGSNTGTLVNYPTYNAANGGSFSFDGIDDYVSSVSNLTLANNFSVSLWLRSTNSYPVQEKYISLGSDRIVIQSNENGNLSSYVTDSTQQNLLGWGLNSNGQLGINDTNGRTTPVTTFAGGTNWKQISCGGNYTAAIKTDGSLWTWGTNTQGQLGTNDTNTRTTPVTTFAGGTTWKSVACGQNHTAAIKTDGSLWTWGWNNFGGLGINISGGDRRTPVTTFAGGNTWKSVAGGKRGHTAAIKTDGTLWGWGFNDFGQLGTNDAIDRSTPVTTFAGGTDWKLVDGGYSHTAAIKTDGTLWGWGKNDFGQLGTSDSATNRRTPVTTFAGGTNWKSIASGNSGTLAIKTDGTLWNWGRNEGRLGTNDGTSLKNTPVTTFAGGTNWKSIAKGTQPAAIKTDGTLWTWGVNSSGQLGTNDTTERQTPVTTFAGGNNWKQVSGSAHTAAIKTDGTFINDDDSNISLLNTKYYNISLTCNGTTIKIHLDSTEILSTTINGTLTSTDVSFTISSLLDSFKGNLAQVSVYNRALTAQEIQQNFIATRSRYSI